MKQITFSEFGTIIMAIIAAILICTSCNPYKQLAKRSPVTHRDSVQLAYRCEATYPIDTTTKTNTVYIRGTDSTEYMLAIIDSLTWVKNKTLTQIIEKYKDTCKGAVNDATDACNACYAQGYAEGKQKGYLRADTVQFTKILTDQRLIMLANEKATVAETKAAKFKMQADRRKNTIFILGGLLLLFLIGGFLIIKNNIKNIVK